jgi:hypothetical protein
MPDSNLERLLGGYATGTLTEEERRALYQAALRDQMLFNALADEQALKELLDDPESRRRLLRALEPVVIHGRAAAAFPAWPPREATGWRRCPMWAWAGGLAVAVIAGIVVWHQWQPLGGASPEPMMTADARSTGEGKANPAPVQRAEPPAPAPPPAPPEAARSEQPAQLVARNEVAPATPPPGAEAETGVAPLPSPAAPLPALAVPLLKPATQEPGAQLKSGPSARELFYARIQEPAPAGAGPAEKRAGGSPRPEARLLAGIPKWLADQSGLAGRGAAKVGNLGKPVERPLGLRASILKREADGNEVEVDSGTVFNEDDALRLTVEVNTPGYLYVLKRTPPGVWSVIFPPTGTRPDPAGRRARVESGTRYLMPTSGSLIGVGQPSPAQFVMVLSREPQADFVKLPAGRVDRQEAGSARAIDLNALVKRIRTEAASGKLMIQRVGPAYPGIPDELAMYAVDRSPVPAPLILTDIMVSHQ